MELTVPCTGPLRTKNDSVSPLGSLPVSVTSLVVSSVAANICGVAVGARLRSTTWIVTVAGSDVFSPSLTVNVKLSVPTKSALGR